MHALAFYGCFLHLNHAALQRGYAAEDEAERAAAAHNRWAERRHDVEPYPCAFCGQWHIGRVMSVEELEAIASRTAPDGADR